MSRSHVNTRPGGGSPPFGRHYGSFRPPPSLVLAVSAGGALGAAARYGIGLWAPPPAGGFPWATLFVNVSGSLLLGVLLVTLLERARPSRHLRGFVGSGFCGAYTTMSAFAVETNLLVRDDRYVLAGTYVLVSIAGGLAAVWLGMHVARRVNGPGAVRKRIGGPP